MQDELQSLTLLANSKFYNDTVVGISNSYQNLLVQCLSRLPRKTKQSSCLLEKRCIHYSNILLMQKDFTSHILNPECICCAFLIFKFQYLKIKANDSKNNIAKYLMFRQIKHSFFSPFCFFSFTVHQNPEQYWQTTRAPGLTAWSAVCVYATPC